MFRIQLVGVVGLTVVVLLMSGGAASAQVTLDPAWPENPREFGGERHDTAYCVQQASDGGYIVAGETFSFGAGLSDVYVIKLDAQGQLDPAWEPNPKTFGGSITDAARCVRQTTDGGYIVAGETFSFGAGAFDIYLIKLDSQGNLDSAWDPNPKTFGGPEYNMCRSIQQTSDGGYIVAGGVTFVNVGVPDVYLMKLDAEGNLDPAWNVNPRTFGGRYHDLAWSVQQTNDGGYIVAGSTKSFGSGDEDIYLIKLDVQGNLDPAWDPNPKTIGGRGLDNSSCVQQTTDGGYILGGYTSPFGAPNGAYLVKLNAQGDFDSAWDSNPKTFEGTGGSGGAVSVLQTTEGGYIVATTISSVGAGMQDVCLFKLDLEGKLDQTWDPNPRIFGGVWPDVPYSIQQTADDGYIVAGSIWYFGAGEKDVWLLKLSLARRFLRGDFDGDGRVVPVPDAIFWIRYLHLGGPEPPCPASCDADGDGDITTTTDAIYILSHFFLGTESPPSPYPACGAGELWTDGPLTCETEPPCP